MNEFVRLQSGVGLQHKARRSPMISRKRFQFVSALLIGALLPWMMRGTLLPGRWTEPAAINTLLANCMAITIAFWMRLSVEIYPGIRRTYVILQSTLSAHGIAVAWFLLTRFPYDRFGLTLGFLLHVVWLFVLYLYAERCVHRRIAVVPFGAVARLFEIRGVRWHRLARPRLEDTRGSNAIAADFSADLPGEWETFLAHAALAGRIVYQHKQLAEALTGQVELEHLSENNFGSLVPVRGYFHVKSILDFLFAIAVLPIALPLMGMIAVAIRLDSQGPILFRQKRVGFAGRDITVYKFRTMQLGSSADDRTAAVTGENDQRVTHIGRKLRKYRLDEFPQIFNILNWEMSWIGPRPEVKILSTWYTQELPFYRYRHVVKPGISGWAQVNQGHVTDVSEVHGKLKYDFYYIKYFSPWLDLLILLRTIKTMLNGFGSR